MIKRLVVLLAIWLSVSFGSEAAVKWHDYVDGFRLAQKTKKNIFVVVASTECRYCKELKKNIEASKEIAETIFNFYIPVLVYKEKDFIPVDLLVESEIVPASFIVSYKTGEIKSGPLFGNQTRTNLLNFLENNIDLH